MKGCNQCISPAPSCQLSPHSRQRVLHTSAVVLPGAGDGQRGASCLLHPHPGHGAQHLGSRQAAGSHLPRHPAHLQSQDTRGQGRQLLCLHELLTLHDCWGQHEACCGELGFYADELQCCVKRAAAPNTQLRVIRGYSACPTRPAHSSGRCHRHLRTVQVSNTSGRHAASGTPDLC